MIDAIRTLNEGGWLVAGYFVLFGLFLLLVAVGDEIANAKRRERLQRQQRIEALERELFGEAVSS